MEPLPLSPPPLPKVKRKRNRTSISCAPCRNRKVLCDRGKPCSACTRMKLADKCVYVEPPKRIEARTQVRKGSSGVDAPQLRTGTPPSPLPDPGHAFANSTAITAYRSGGTPVSTLSPNAYGPGEAVNSLLERVRVLEHQLSGVRSRRNGESEIPSPAPSALSASLKSMHKTRYFGETHWGNWAALVCHLDPRTFCGRS